MACQNSNRGSILGVDHRQSAKVEMSKHLKCFGKCVSHVDYIRFLNHVGAKVDNPMHVALTNLLDFLVFSISGVGITVEHPPIQKVFRVRELLNVLLPSVKR